MHEAQKTELNFQFADPKPQRKLLQHRHESLSIENNKSPFGQYSRNHVTPLSMSGNQKET